MKSSVNINKFFSRGRNNYHPTSDSNYHPTSDSNSQQYASSSTSSQAYASTFESDDSLLTMSSTLGSLPSRNENSKYMN